MENRDYKIQGVGVGVNAESIIIASCGYSPNGKWHARYEEDVI